MISFLLTDPLFARKLTVNLSQLLCHVHPFALRVVQDFLKLVVQHFDQPVEQLRAA